MRPGPHNRDRHRLDRNPRPWFSTTTLWNIVAVLLAATFLNIILALYGLHGLDALNHINEYWLALIAFGAISNPQGPFRNDR